MVKIDLITGFLGAGKTTFLLKYARYLLNKGERLGILEYDYGSVNVDMVLLGPLRGDNCELEMIDASGDADSLKRRFRTKLIAMAMSGYTRVLVEPSGVFDMDVFFDILRDEPLENFYEIGSVLTIVNAEIEDDLPREADFILASQAAGAGTIVLSRTQLVSQERCEKAKEHVRKAAAAINCRNFHDSFFEKDWSELTDEDFERLKTSGYHPGEYIKLVGGDNSSFGSVVFMNPCKNLDEMKEKIREAFSSKDYGDIYRIKGFISDGGTAYQVNATAREINVDTKVTGPNVIIVIGTGLNQAKLTEVFHE